MKKTIYTAITLLALFTMYSCKEEAPTKPNSTEQNDEEEEEEEEEDRKMNRSFKKQVLLLVQTNNLQSMIEKSYLKI